MSVLKPKNETKTSPLDDLQVALGGDMNAVNDLIIKHMQSEVPLIPQLASYLIASGGKRIRPLLTLASTQIFNGEMSRAHALAASVEFIHTATLLHDDVVDNSEERRGKESANVVFGNEASVLVGDFLFSRAFQLMVSDGSLEVLRILSNASAIISEGEVKQLSTQNNLDTSMDDYLKVIEGKTASLFAAACEVGPVIADQNKETIKSLRDYGMALGMAFQIADDVLDYDADRQKLGKTIGDDFREGKMTAPILFALEKANDEERAFWERTLGQKDQNDSDLEKAQDLIRKHDALGEGLALAEGFGDQAIKALRSVPDSAIKDMLVTLVPFSIHREY
ncbi:MAG: polyprenyl synthetase family protein [Alphaproteobacteria bacterium]|nr:polyprenyl synthetase family protein [Alphaproteobacteria bacterium]